MCTKIGERYDYGTVWRIMKCCWCGKKYESHPYDTDFRAMGVNALNSIGVDGEVCGHDCARAVRADQLFWRRLEIYKEVYG